jgi:aldose 1-epimerase
MPDLVLQHGRTRVTVSPEYGGRIAQIEVEIGGRPVQLLVDAAEQPPAERDPLAWGCFPMAPWPNRIADGRFSFEGATYGVTPDYGPHAIHGLTVRRAWRVEELDGTRCMLSLDFDERWPWRGSITHEMTAHDGGLTTSLRVVAAAAQRFPAGVGWHPWFRRTVGGHGVAVGLQAAERYELQDMIPTGRTLPVAGTHDLRAAPEVGERRLDDCYRGVRSPIVVRWGELALSMEPSDNVLHAMVYTPPHAVCVEPQTCTVDAFNLDARNVDGTGIVVVTPESPLVATARWRWSLRQLPTDNQ